MNNLERGMYVMTPDGEGRILEIITHPTLPTMYRIWLCELKVDKDYTLEQLSATN